MIQHLLQHSSLKIREEFEKKREKVDEKKPKETPAVGIAKISPENQEILQIAGSLSCLLKTISSLPSMSSTPICIPAVDICNSRGYRLHLSCHVTAPQSTSHIPQQEDWERKIALPLIATRIQMLCVQAGIKYTFPVSVRDVGTLENTQPQTALSL